MYINKLLLSRQDTHRTLVGLIHHDHVSRLCKLSFFDVFHGLCMYRQLSIAIYPFSLPHIKSVPIQNSSRQTHPRLPETLASQNGKLATPEEDRNRRGEYLRLEKRKICGYLLVAFQASGQLGKPTLKALVEEKRFDITIITRQSSGVKFPTDAAISTRAVDYADKAALVSALKGQEAFVLVLGFQAIPDQEIALIEAVIEAGVKYILPTEFGADNANDGLAQMVPINVVKAAPRAKIEELGKDAGAGWIGVVTNAWFEYVGLSYRVFQYNLHKTGFLSASILGSPHIDMRYLSPLRMAISASIPSHVPRHSMAAVRPCSVQHSSQRWDSP